MTGADTPVPASACICVLDDDAEVRGALGSLFRAAGFEVALFASPEAFLAAPRPAQPSCLVLDIRLQGADGLDFQARLSEEGVAIPVILITGHGDIPMSVRGIKAGAIDFLPKPFSDQAMLAAVEAALALDRSRRDRDEAGGQLRELHAALSAREREVMALVVAGLMNKQVAARLELSEITVKIHRGNVMRKMGAQSLADLVRMAELLAVRDPTISRYHTSV